MKYNIFTSFCYLQPHANTTFLCPFCIFYLQAGGKIIQTTKTSNNLTGAHIKIIIRVQKVSALIKKNKNLFAEEI